MKFKLQPILSEIKQLYSKPPSTDRFKEYLSKLQGDTKGDLSLPISGFNPMAKDHILEKIDELEQLNAETIMEATIEQFNASLDQSDDEYLVVLNLADDLKGGWTNHYSTDFDSKFKLNAFVNRKFCVPYFWTSESYTKEIIRLRTLEYLKRTVFRVNNPRPKTLKEHFQQEVYSLSVVDSSHFQFEKNDFEKIEQFYLENQNSEAYDKIFNFFYGDAASESLGYKKYGILKPLGNDYARFIG